MGVDHRKEIERILLEELAREGWGADLLDTLPEAERHLLEEELFPSFLDREVARLERLRKRQRWLWAGIALLAAAATPLLFAGDGTLFFAVFFVLLAAALNLRLGRRLRRKRRLLERAMRALDTQG